MRMYRASSLGYSLEALVAPHLGFEPVPPPEFIQRAYDEGTRIEPLAIEKLRGLGWIIRDKQDTLNEVGDFQIEVGMEVIPESALVRGHLDGIVREGGFADYVIWNSVLEVKVMAKDAWEAFNKHGWDAPGLVQKYKWQASCYMLATGLPHVMVAWRKGEDDDDPRLAFAVATEPFYTISDIANKLKAAEDAIESGVVPDGCEDFPCPFYYLHPPKEAVEKVEDDELESLMAEWLRMDQLVKHYGKMKDELRDEIFATLGTKDAVAAAKIKGACGVTVETYWQNGSEYTVTKKEGWVTRVSGPRGKNAAK